jgi:hypothetical protein
VKFPRSRSWDRNSGVCDLSQGNFSKQMNKKKYFKGSKGRENSQAGRCCQGSQATLSLPSGDSGGCFVLLTISLLKAESRQGFVWVSLSRGEAAVRLWQLIQQLADEYTSSKEGIWTSHGLLSFLLLTFRSRISQICGQRENRYGFLFPLSLQEQFL